MTGAVRCEMNVAMRVHYREYRVECREIDKHMINAILMAHYR